MEFRPNLIEGVQDADCELMLQLRDKLFPKLELVRLTIPRRVYTSRHLTAVARSVADVYARREQTRGLELVFEPTYLRFFQARFRPLGAA